MECTGTLKGLGMDFMSKQQRIELEINEDVRAEVDKLRTAEKLRIKIVRYRNKRSLDANAYLWLLLNEMAQVLYSSKEELYIMCLERYGTFSYILVPEDAIDSMKAVYRVVRDRGSTTITTESGKKVKCRQLQCYKGSSQYDTKEMSVLLDGVVGECRELDIQTETPEELRKMKERWGVDV